VESVAARPGWDTITAVEEGNVIALDGDVAGRWGPRTVDLMRAILDAVEDGLS
jgi:iron complex transport system substrate-binding protein